MFKKVVCCFLAAACMLAASSCSKDVSKSVVGQYHFKISGNIECKCVTKGFESKSLSLLVSNEAGQMRILNDYKGGYIVTMSVMISSYTLTFDATVDKKNRKINLLQNEGILKVAEKGSSSSLAQSVPAIQVRMGGSGDIYDGTIIFDMCPEGIFELDTTLDEGGTMRLEYEIIQEDVICLANKE